jgi:hypothetical protein
LAAGLLACGALAGLLVAAAADPTDAATTRPGGARARTALPDSVVVRLPHKDLTAHGIQATWARLDPRYRPAGEGTARARAFVDQLIEKEAMARAALAEPFTPSPPESARMVSYRSNLERQELYRILILDSTRVTPADYDSVRQEFAAGQDSAEGRKAPPPPEAIEAGARKRAERRRGEEFESRIRVELAPAWDDSVAALLARGYAGSDSTVPDLSNPFQAAMKERRPRLAPADSGRVLVTSSVGVLTAASFADRFAALNPLQSPVPTTAGTVKARGEQFLGQIWFDAEVARRRIGTSPSVAAALAERRESIALDHWYDRHVRTAIDTSETKLRAHYAADPARYGTPAHALITHWPVARQAAGDSLVALLAAGMPWDSLCARVAQTDAEREGCGRTISIDDQAPDSALVARLKELAPGQAYVRSEPATNSFRVVRLVERNPARVRPFEEVRTYVGRDLAGRQAEAALTVQMAALVKAMPKTVNEAAIARLKLEP